MVLVTLVTSVFSCQQPLGAPVVSTGRNGYVIAGSGAPALIKSQADLVLTGTSDQALINAFTLARHPSAFYFWGDINTDNVINLYSNSKYVGAGYQLSGNCIFNTANTYAGACFAPADNTTSNFGITLEGFAINGGTNMTIGIDFTAVGLSEIHMVKVGGGTTGTIGVKFASVSAAINSIYNNVYDLETNTDIGVSFVSGTSGNGSAGTNRFFGGRINGTDTAVLMRGYTQRNSFYGSAISGNKVGVDVNGINASNLSSQNYFIGIDMENGTANCTAYKWGAYTYNNVVVGGYPSVAGTGAVTWSDASTYQLNEYISWQGSSKLSTLSLAATDRNPLTLGDFYGFIADAIRNEYQNSYTWADATENVTGTGATLVNGERAYLALGTTKVSTASRYMGAYLSHLSSSYFYAINWSKRIQFTFSLTASYSSSLTGTKTRVQLTQSTMPNDLAALGIGIEIQGTRIYLATYGASGGYTLVDSGVDITHTSNRHVFTLVHINDGVTADGPYVRLYYDGTLIASQTTATAIPSGTPTANYNILASFSRDSSGTTDNDAMYIGSVRIINEIS